MARKISENMMNIFRGLYPKVPAEKERDFMKIFFEYKRLKITVKEAKEKLKKSGFLIVVFVFLVKGIGMAQIGWSLRQIESEPTYSYTLLNSKGYIQTVHEVIQLPWTDSYKLTKVFTFTSDSICSQMEIMVHEDDLPALRAHLNKQHNQCLITDKTELWIDENHFYFIIDTGDCYKSFITTRYKKVTDGH